MDRITSRAAVALPTCAVCTDTRFSGFGMYGTPMATRGRPGR